MPTLVFYVASLPAIRVLTGWVYGRTGESLLIAMLMRASFSASSLIFEPLTLGVARGLIYCFAYAATLWVVVAVVAVASRGQLARQPLHTRVA